MFEQDWLMRQIEAMTLGIARAIFRKESVTYPLFEDNYDLNGEATGADLLYLRLRGMIVEGKLNEAEDELFREFQPGEKRYLALATDFYAALNNLSDQELAAGNFSREEISEGLHDIMELAGVEWGEAFPESN